MEIKENMLDSIPSKWTGNQAHIFTSQVVEKNKRFKFKEKMWENIVLVEQKKKICLLELTTNKGLLVGK